MTLLVDSALLFLVCSPHDFLARVVAPAKVLERSPVVAPSDADSPAPARHARRVVARAVGRGRLGQVEVLDVVDAV